MDRVAELKKREFRIFQVEDLMQSSWTDRPASGITQAKLTVVIVTPYPGLEAVVRSDKDRFYLTWPPSSTTTRWPASGPYWRGVSLKWITFLFNDIFCSSNVLFPTCLILTSFRAARSIGSWTLCFEWYDSCQVLAFKISNMLDIWDLQYLGSPKIL